MAADATASGLFRCLLECKCEYDCSRVLFVPSGSTFHYFGHLPVDELEVEKWHEGQLYAAISAVAARKEVDPGGDVEVGRDR